MGQVIGNEVLCMWRAYKNTERERRRSKARFDYTRLSVPDNFYWQCVGPLTQADPHVDFWVLTGKDTGSILIQF